MVCEHLGSEEVITRSHHEFTKTNHIKVTEFVLIGLPDQGRPLTV